MHRTISPDTSDNAIEQEIISKGLTAPRITPADLEAAVAFEQYHVFPGTMLTVCCLTLRNGFTVTGESACASPENFNAELGIKIARASAVNKLWPLLGYALKQRLHEIAHAQPPADNAHVAPGCEQFAEPQNG